MPTPSFDVAAAQRWFAIEFNNRAWELIESPSRSEEETWEMLSAAHASDHHWRQIGQPINFARGAALVAAAYLAAGEAQLALKYSQRCLALCEQAGDVVTPFDLAGAHGGIACALGKLGERERAEAAYQQALAQAEQFEDDGDREVLEKLYPPPA